MRTFLSLLALAALACASAQADLVVNDIVDALLKRLSNNEHITSLPDLEEDADVKVLFWNTSVEIEASSGAPIGGVVLKRFGDASLKMNENKNLALDVEVGFDEAQLTYDYTAEVAGLKGPGGHFTATVGATSVQATILLDLDSIECDVIVSTAKVAKLGEITVQDGGSKVVNAVYRKLLVDMLAKKRLYVLQKAIRTGNRGFDCESFLPPIFKATLPATFA